MSRLNQLIQELCPDGVEYRRLKDVCTFKRGTPITKKDIVEGDIPVIAGGQEPAYYHNQANRTGETVVISSSGAAGFVSYWEQPIFVSDAFSVEPNGKILTKYLYYFLKSKQDKIYSLQKVGGVPHVYSTDIAPLKFPLPPLIVQQEIVRILDTFTELIKELNAELEARKKQYEYYRDLLLTFDDEVELIAKLCPDGVPYKRLGELGYFYGGLSGKSKEDFTNGNAKFITYMNVFTNLAIDTDISDLVRIGENEKQNTVQYGDILFTGSSETLDECGMSSVLTEVSDEKFYLNSFCFGFRLKDNNLLLPDFSKHLFRSQNIRKQIKRTANGVTRFNVSKKKMEQVVIPLPPLPVQQEIVRILDNFTELIAELTAELTARQKQYEYYRDKLLSFKKVSS